MADFDSAKFIECLCRTNNVMIFVVLSTLAGARTLYSYFYQSICCEHNKRGPMQHDQILMITI